MLFNSCLHIPSVGVDTETEWTLFCAATAKVVVQGHNVVGVDGDGNPCGPPG